MGPQINYTNLNLQMYRQFIDYFSLIFPFIMKILKIPKGYLKPEKQWPLGKRTKKGQKDKPSPYISWQLFVPLKFNIKYLCIITRDKDKRMSDVCSKLQVSGGTWLHDYVLVQDIKLTIWQNDTKKQHFIQITNTKMYTYNFFNGTFNMLKNWTWYTWDTPYKTELLN